MTIPLLLFGTAVLVAAFAGRPLSSAVWAGNAPRLAVTLWLALSAGVLSSIVLAGLAVAVPQLPQVITGGLSDLLARCAMALQTEYGAPTAALPLAIVLLMVGSLIVGRLLASLISTARGTNEARRSQIHQLTVVGHRLPDQRRIVLLDDSRPAAYCVPRGRHGSDTIVVTSGAVRLLGDDQLSLLIAHERAHLHQRHHLAALFSGSLGRAFTWVPLFRHAAVQVPILLEMAADDHAIRVVAERKVRDVSTASTRRRLADALLTLATAEVPSPAGSLAAAGGSAVARVRRLSQPAEQLGVTQMGLFVVAVGLAAGGPLLVASWPAWCAAAMQICSFAFAA